MTIIPNSQQDEEGDWRILKPYKPLDGNKSDRCVIGTNTEVALNFSKNFKIMRKKITYKCNCEDDIPPIEEQFKDIMENFDFKHVAMMMNWEYARVEYDDDGNHLGYDKWKTLHRPENSTGSVEELFDPINLRVPTVAELKRDAENLLKSVIRFHKYNPRSRFYMTATGPFKATCRYGILELECIFTSWSCD